MRRAMAALGDWYHARSRSKKSRWIAGFIEENGVRTALVIGTNPRNRGWENKIEQEMSLQVEYLLFSGLSQSPDARPYVAANGLALPFRDQAFDLAFSNAVVEHVGGRDEQVRFLAEHARVARMWVATTPNRWFPIESHTLAVLRHWSPRWRARQAIFSRLLSKREFGQVIPPDGKVVSPALAPTFIAHGGDDPAPSSW